MSPSTRRAAEHRPKLEVRGQRRGDQATLKALAKRLRKEMAVAQKTGTKMGCPVKWKHGYQNLRFAPSVQF